jgi:glycine/D-amino acid oxidase-like deaminating enzyme
MTRPLQWPPSIWAAATPEGPAWPALDTSISTDVAVIGAGFTGLSTALHLARQGIAVTVIEAAEPGWGASGRNNGQVIPTLTRPDPEDIIARHGEAGERLVHLIRDSAANLFDLIRAEGIAAEAEQTGWIQPVHTPGRMRIAQRRQRQWAAHGAPAELLSAREISERLGSQAWHGGWWNPTGGHINPLALARGLAQAAHRAGARLYARTPVLSMTRTTTGSDSGWVLGTAAGQIRARALVLATNAYTGEFAPQLAPAIAREVVPVLSWQMATAPVSEAARRIVIPGRQAVSDTHGELYFMRFDARHRLITGGALVNPRNGAQRLQPTVGARLQALFPALGTVRFDHVWNGFIGMTDDYFPRMHRLAPDAVTWVGCNGRGVGLSVALGRELARAVTGTPDDQLALPFTEPRPLTLHGLARRIAPLMLLLYRYRDAREIAG